MIQIVEKESTKTKKDKNEHNIRKGQELEIGLETQSHDKEFE